jgi:hypothetical protein
MQGAIYPGKIMSWVCWNGKKADALNTTSGFYDFEA